MAQPDKKEFHEQLQKIEELVGAIESAADSRVRSSAIELMRTLMELHSAGIERMMEVVFESSPKGVEIIDEFARDELVESLMLLYGLHPLDVETRVIQALEKARPTLQKHGGSAELVSIEDGVVRLRMIGKGGCPSTSVKLKQAIEKAITEAAPDVVSIISEDAVEQPKISAFVQIKGIQQRAAV